LAAWHSGQRRSVYERSYPTSGLTICGQEYHLGVYPAIKVNSALHPSEVAKSSTCLNLIQAPGWDEGGKVTSAGWQVTLCDPNGM